MSKLLEEHDYETVAHLLDCDVAAVKAVAEVESAGEGFLQDGRTKILFEGHVFYKYTKGKYKDSHPDICYTPWTKQYYLGGSKELGEGRSLYMTILSGARWVMGQETSGIIGSL